MALNIIKQVSTCCRHQLRNTCMRSYKVYEPPYLTIKHEGPPLYPVLNIRLKGYDFPLLEKYQSLISKIANQLDIDIDFSYAYPHQALQVEKFKKQSAIVDAVYNLKLYERNIVISNVNSIQIPILIRLLEQGLPSGISLDVYTYDPASDKKRYVPDKELHELKVELDELQKPKK